MTFLEFRQKAKVYSIFRTVDVLKWFPEAKKQSVLHQLTLWVKKKYLTRLRQDLYVLEDYAIQDSRVLTSLLYGPSYLSLETALNSYGMIPDIPFYTTAVTTQKTKVFRAPRYGTFSYRRVKPELFFGFRFVPQDKTYGYSIALPEKALFDYFYLNAPNKHRARGFVEEMRLSVPESFSFRDLRKWQKLVPSSAKNFHSALTTFRELYDQ